MGAVRLFLALVVVFDHVRGDALRPQGLDVSVAWALGFNAGYAVMFFYIISGFLIGYALNTKYTFSKAGSREFYASRFIRIFCLYWPVAAIVLIGSVASRERFLSGTILDKFTSLFLLGIDWNSALADYPNQHLPASILYLGQAWTLGPELLFYIFAPFLLRSKAAIAGVLVGSAAIRAAAVHQFGFHFVWTYRFFPATALFFMLGAGIDAIGRRYAIARHRALIAGPVLCVGFLMFPDYATWDSPRFWVAVLLFTVGLPGLFEATKNRRILNFFGDLSYPVYLVHGFLIALAVGMRWQAWAVALAGPYGLMAMVVAMSLATAIFAHYAIEAPIGRLMRRVGQWSATIAAARPAV